MSLVIKKYPDLSEPLYFYGGTEMLRFSPSKWLYLWEHFGRLEPINGVTSICHIIDRSQALMPWAVKVALKRTYELMQEHRRGDGFYEVFETELQAILEAARKTDRELLEEAGDIGHLAHEWIESYIQSVLSRREQRTLELLSKLPMEERAANACIAALEWMDSHNVRWQATERRVFSRRYKYAGTLDGLAVIDSCNDPFCCPHKFTNRLSITDWKTSNYLYVEYLLQTAAYWQAFYEETGTKVEDRWIIRLGKEDAEFDPWHAPGQAQMIEDFKAYKLCLDLSLTIGSIKGRISDVSAVRRELKKQQRAAEKLAQDKIRCPKADEYKGKRLSKCLPDGTQCEACAAIYAAKHGGKNDTSEEGSTQSA